MSRITNEAMAKAIVATRAMGLQEKEPLADEIFRVQPNLLASLLGLPRLGVALQKVEFALDILLVCFLAMKASGRVWPLITEDEQGRQMQRLAGIIRFGADLGTVMQERSMQQYIADHPEKILLAYVMTETSKWMASISQEESDKYVLLAVLNLVNCIAFAARPPQKNKPPVARKTGRS